MFQYTNEDNFNKIIKQVQQRRKNEQERKVINVLCSEPIQGEHVQNIDKQAKVCSNVSQHFERTASKEYLDQESQLSNLKLFQRTNSSDEIVKESLAHHPGESHTFDNEYVGYAVKMNQLATRHTMTTTTFKHCRLVTNVSQLNVFGSRPSQQCDKNVHRILQFRKKIIAELNNMESLKSYLYEPDGVQESLRVEKREKEFHTRFNRNYMFQLKIQLCEVEQCGNWKEIPQKLATAYSTAFQSLQALFHQMFSSTCSKIINKLYKMLLQLNKQTAFYQNVGICYITKTEDEINKNKISQDLKLSMDCPSFQLSKLCIMEKGKTRVEVQSSKYKSSLDLPTLVSKDDNIGDSSAGRSDGSPTKNNLECDLPDVHKRSIHIQTEPYNQENSELLSKRTVGLQQGKSKIHRYKHLSETNALDTSDQSSEVSEFHSANGLNMLISQQVSKNCHHQNVALDTNSLAMKEQRVQHAKHKSVEVSERISDSEQSGSGKKNMLKSITVAEKESVINLGEVSEKHVEQSAVKHSVIVNEGISYPHSFERWNDKCTSTSHDAITQTDVILDYEEEQLILVQQNCIQYSDVLAPFSESSLLLNQIERISDFLVQEMLQNVVAEMGSEVLIDMVYQLEFDLLHIPKPPVTIGKPS